MGCTTQSMWLIFRIFYYIFQGVARRPRGLSYAIARRNSPPLDTSLHEICTQNMAAILKEKSGSWRVQIRRKGRTLSETFVRHDDAEKWGVDAERQIDCGETPTLSRTAKLRTFGDLIDLHVTDMTEVGRPPGRLKAATLDMLKRRLGSSIFTFMTSGTKGRAGSLRRGSRSSKWPSSPAVRIGRRFGATRTCGRNPCTRSPRHGPRDAYEPTCSNFNTTLY